MYPARPVLIREAAYDELRRAILEGRIAAGERLLEPDLAQRLGVSRTPVREAILRLSQEGLVELLPNRGARVRLPTTEEVAEVYEVRSLIEAEAARLAVLVGTEEVLPNMGEALVLLEQLPALDYAGQIEADRRFHTVLVDASGNRVLATVFHALDAQMALVRQRSRDLNQTRTTHFQHQAILDALRARNAQGAAEAAKRHVLYFKRVVLERLREGKWS